MCRMKTCSRFSHLLLELISISLFPVFEASNLEVPPEVAGTLGSNVTLPCHFIHSSTETTISQVQWDLQAEGQRAKILVFNSKYGMDFPESPLKGRVNISGQSLTITDVKTTDEGFYICKIAAYPTGSFEEKTKLTVVEHNVSEEHKVHLSAEITAAVVTASVVCLVILAAISYLLFIRRSNSASRLQVLIDTSGRGTNINQPSFIVKEQEVVYSQIKLKPSRDSVSSSSKERSRQTAPADDVTYSEVQL